MRGFNYPPDRIRLSLVCTEAVMSTIANAFQFQTRAVTTPPPVFGSPDATVPPGALFQNGQHGSPEQGLVAVRGIYVSSRQVVIEVGGGTESADRVFEHLIRV